MTRLDLIGCGLAAFAATMGTAHAGEIPQPINKFEVMNQFQAAHPGTGFANFAGRIECVYGPAFSFGNTAEASAEQFKQNYSAIWGVPAADLAPVGPFENGQHQVGLMHDPATGASKFTAVYYSQQHNGVPLRVDPVGAE
jgi:hypothetical protein